MNKTDLNTLNAALELLIDLQDCYTYYDDYMQIVDNAIIEDFKTIVKREQMMGEL